MTTDGLSPAFPDATRRRIESNAPRRYHTTKVYDQFKSGGKIRKHHPNEHVATLDPLELVCVRGDVNVTVYDYDWGGKNTKIAGVWFNTAFIDNNFLVFDKVTLDGAVKDKKHKIMSEHFKLEVYLREADPSEYDDQQGYDNDDLDDQPWDEEDD